MSDDYAAITTSIMLAVLVIATMQAERLLKAWYAPLVEARKRWWAVEDEIAAHLRAGREVTHDDLARLRDVRAQAACRANEMGALSNLLKIICVGGPWLLLCLQIVSTVVYVLRWAATPDPDPSPALARLAFYTTTASVVALIASLKISTLARGFLSGFTFNRRKKDHLTQGTQLYELYQQLHEYETSLGTDDAEGDPRLHTATAALSAAGDTPRHHIAASLAQQHGGSTRTWERLLNQASQNSPPG
ncbi:hypothetical protein [Streptomyces variegatus]|uniref:hypothetical protein n=1 Tax=Streptomyces variegatus TaxID=284040 RepID=UPI003C2B89C7